MNWLDETQSAGSGLEGEAAQQPLRIVVTSGAKEQMALRTLARKALPMLRTPNAFTSKQRHQLAQAFAELLEENDEETEAQDEEEDAFARVEGGEWP